MTSKGHDLPRQRKPPTSGGPLVALLDRTGILVEVNDAWTEFARDNGADPATTGVGVSYFSVCDTAGNLAAQRSGDAVRAALAGRLSTPTRMLIPCRSPGTTGWFDMLVSSRFDDHGDCVGATVSFRAAGPPAPVDTSRVSHAEATSAPRLTFPDVPRLELEETLTLLTLQAKDVLRSQGRLRALLRANAMVAGELNLRIVLRHIVEAARDLVGAGYAALGVMAADGTLREFVHVGMEPEQTEHVGQLPRGDGILGLLISHPDPMRRRDLNAHPAAVGFPAGHPPMPSFVGVPIRVRGQVFGNLYLTESTNGEFTSEDEQLLTSLASSAGVAIENARLYEDSERRRRWQAVSTEATQELFTGSHEDPLEVVLRFAMEAAEGDFAMLSRVDEDEHVLVETIIGEPVGILTGGRTPLLDDAIEPVFRSGKPVLLEGYSGTGDRNEHQGGRIGSVIAAPLLNDQQVIAAVVVGRVAGEEAFDETDLDQLAGFAGHAGVALELDQSRTDRETLAALREHDRIAADLHDHVIQELFAVGMGLQGMAGRLDRPEQRSRVLGYVDTLDETIRRIRQTIFQLHHPLHESQTLEQRLVAVLEDEHAALGFTANLELSDPLDDAVSAELADDVVAVVRESLSNAARHADASNVTVHVGESGGLLTVDVIDDGRGIGVPTRSSGLANMRSRAERHGGDLVVVTQPSGGTHLCWTGRCGA